jgi:hypothetical protein
MEIGQRLSPAIPQHGVKLINIEILSEAAWVRYVLNGIGGNIGLV